MGDGELEKAAGPGAPDHDGSAARDDLAAMRARIDAQRKAEEDILNAGDEAEEDDGSVNKYFVSECFRQSERGDGRLFARLHRGKFVFVKRSQMWLVWDGHHWKIDKEDLAHNAVEDVALVYEQQIRDIDEQLVEAAANGRKVDEKLFADLIKAYKGRVKKLRDVSGAEKCQEKAHKIGNESLSIIGDEIDQKPWLLPCSNGVIDLKTGKLLDGRPDDYLVASIPVAWKSINEPAPLWEKFIREIHSRDSDQESDELYEFVNRLFGYSVTGLVSEHFIGTFIGEGRNGKGTMFETLRAIMGDLAWSVKPELILDNKNVRQAGGPSPELVSLQGKRFVIASETDEHRRISGSRVKELTGGDTICARAPHEKFESNFRPTHKLFLYTNHVPKGLAKDYALAKRLLLINYPFKYVDNPSTPTERQRDPNLPVKLLAEAPGILAWLVRGCIKWQERGLDPPEQIRFEVEQLRQSEDHFGRWFETAMEPTSSTIAINFADIYGRYKAWYLEEVSDKDTYLDSKIKVSTRLQKEGFTRDAKGGIAKFVGLQFKPLRG